MTRTTNARVAGFTFLIYIALGIAAMVLSGRAGNAEGIAAFEIPLGVWLIIKGAAMRAR